MNRRTFLKALMAAPLALLLPNPKPRRRLPYTENLELRNGVWHKIDPSKPSVMQTRYTSVWHDLARHHGH